MRSRLVSLCCSLSGSNISSFGGCVDVCLSCYAGNSKGTKCENVHLDLNRCSLGLSERECLMKKKVVFDQ